MNALEIAGRYAALANDTCCLSCDMVDMSGAKLNEVCIDLEGVFFMELTLPMK